MRIRRTLAAAIVASGAMGLLAAQTAAADDGRDEGIGRSAHAPIVGAWTVDVTPVDCTTGTPVAPTRKALALFDAGGTQSEPVASTARTGSVGTWRRTGRDTYVSDSIFLTFAGGAWSGTQDIRREIVMAADGRTWTAKVLSQVRDVSGIAQGPVICVRAAATRFE